MFGKIKKRFMWARLNMFNKVADYYIKETKKSIDRTNWLIKKTTETVNKEKHLARQLGVEV